MSIFADHHSSSARPHFALMVVLFLTASGLGFGMFLGWRLYFNNVAMRSELIRLSAIADERLDQEAAERAVKIRASTRSATATPALPASPTIMTSPTGPAVSLANADSTANDPGFPEPDPISENLAPERQRAAEELQRQFWRSSKWEEKSAFVVDAPRVVSFMRDYYEKQKNPDPIVGDLKQQAHFKLNHTEVLLYTFSGPRVGGTVDMAMVAQPDGTFLIDWESFVGSSDIGWSDFKKQRPAEPKLFRVFANLDDYYSYEFEDAKKYLCLHLASPDGFYFIKGYCERGSTIEHLLSDLFASGPSRRALTLRLAFPENAKSDHCVRITGVVANRWLLVP